MKKLYIIFAFVIVQAIAIYLLNINLQEKRADILNSNNEFVEAEYSTVTNSFNTLANTVFKGFIDKKDIIDTFASRDRKSLYEKLKKDYIYLSGVDFKQIHFHLPNNHSFLRMHKPEKFGDDLTNIRHSIKYVNANQKPILGRLEMGKVVPGFRFVYPLNKGREHIGSVETSFGIFAFINQMEKAYPSHIHFLMSKDLLNSKAFKEDKKTKFKNSMEHKEYAVLRRSSQDTSRVSCDKEDLKSMYKNELKEIVSSGIFSKKTFSFEVEINEKGHHSHKVITFKPLKNIENKSIGYFVVYQDSKRLHEIKDQFINKIIISLLILSLLSIVIYKQLMQKEILKFEVGEKTAKLQEAAVQAEEHAAEIEMMNVSLEERIKQEIEKNTEQERKLASQSKQAALGDMIGNIAHQWRQPLSAISTAASGMQLNKEMGFLEDDDFIKFTDGIVKNANYLSQTIDDFRDFIKAEKVFKEFDVSNSVEKCLAIVNSSINNHKLHLVTNFEEGIRINNYSNELQQVIINIFNNSKDALKEKVEKESDRIIFIDTYKDKEFVYVKIKDTAGGIPDSIMDKIFEPYFTTKHQSQGTGLGLYMSHEIVVDSMNGGIDVENVDFEYKDKSYSGAQFVLSFKLDSPPPRRNLKLK